jgi:hypothetical protein
MAQANALESDSIFLSGRILISSVKALFISLAHHKQNPEVSGICEQRPHYFRLTDLRKASAKANPIRSKYL